VSRKKPENSTLAAVAFDATTYEIGVDLPTAGHVTTAIAAEGTSYELTYISFSIVHYDLPKQLLMQ
jgi:hypothetical protein